MSVTSKVVTRYEAVCDTCGAFVGEFSDSREAYETLATHWRTHP